VSTLVVGREASVRTYNEIGVSDPHHPLSHHRNVPENLEKLSKINAFHVSLFGYFLERMKNTKEGDSNLLERSMIVYGSAIADGNTHSHFDLPVILAGSGGGKLRPGRHIQYAKGTPMTNLYIALLDHMDIRMEKLGDSNGRLEHLADL